MLAWGKGSSTYWLQESSLIMNARRFRNHGLVYGQLAFEAGVAFFAQTTRPPPPLPNFEHVIVFRKRKRDSIFPKLYKILPDFKFESYDEGVVGVVLRGKRKGYLSFFSPPPPPTVPKAKPDTQAIKKIARGTQREYSSKPLNIALLNLF